MSNLNLPLQLQPQGLLFILSAPSGGGKTSLTKKLIKEDDNLIRSISITTRLPRGAEVDGKDYYFTSQANFKELVEKEEILESAEIYGNMYGTPKSVIIENIKNGIDIIFDINWQGAKSIKAKMPKESVSVFILPPSLKELEKRLISRGEDESDVIIKRLEAAKSEIEHAIEYDYIIINDNFDKTLTDLQAILRAERLKRIKFDLLRF